MEHFEIIDVYSEQTSPENSQLDILAEGLVIAIHQPQEVLAAMDAWDIMQHRKSGLIDRSVKSTNTCRRAELESLEFIR